VLRYTACDYDCYHQGRYIGSRATLPKAIEAVEYEQAKAARHPQLSPTANATIATYQEELRAIAARLHDLANHEAGRARDGSDRAARRGCLTPRSAIMNNQHLGTVQQITGQMRSMFYLVDEPTTMLTIQADGQTIAARASGQLALDLRALPRGATICATLNDEQLDCPQLLGFTVIPF